MCGQQQKKNVGKWGTNNWIDLDSNRSENKEQSAANVYIIYKVIHFIRTVNRKCIIRKYLSSILFITML